MTEKTAVYEYEDQNRNLKIFFFAFCLFLIIFLIILDFWRLFHSPLPLGLDGYYYFLQCETFNANGRFYFPTYTPFTLLFFSLIASILNDTVTAVKVGALALNLLLNLGIFSIIIKVTKTIWLGILSLIVLQISNLHYYLLIEYLSYLGAITCLIWGFYCVIQFYETRRNFWILLSVICFLASVGSHASGLPILFIVVFISIWFKFIINSNNSPLPYKFIIPVLLFCIAFLMPAIIFLQSVFLLPVKLEDAFTYIPHFPVTISMFPEMIILVCSLVILFLLFYSMKETLQKNFLFLFGTCIVWTLLITLNPFISTDLGFTNLGGRLRLLVYIQIAVLVPGVISLLKTKYKSVHWYFILLIIPFMVWSFMQPLPRGGQSDYLSRRLRLVEGLKVNKNSIESNSLIIAEHGEEFLITAVTGTPSQQRYPKDNKYSSVYWMLNLIPPTLLDSSMKIIAKDTLGFYTVLVKNDENLQERLKNPTVRQVFRSSNRHLNNYLSENIR